MSLYKFVYFHKNCEVMNKYNLAIKSITVDFVVAIMYA